MGCHFLLQGIFPTQKLNPGYLRPGSSHQVPIFSETCMCDRLSVLVSPQGLPGPTTGAGICGVPSGLTQGPPQSSFRHLTLRPVRTWDSRVSPTEAPAPYTLSRVRLFVTPWTIPWNSPGQNTGMGPAGVLVKREGSLGEACAVSFSLLFTQRGLAPRSKGKARAELRPARRQPRLPHSRSLLLPGRER